MFSNKTVNVILAVLMVVFLAVPVLAIASPDQTTTPQATTSNNTANNSNKSNTETTETATTPAPAEPGMEEALADAEAAVRQAQAERIRQELDNLGIELERLNTEYFAESAKLGTIETSLNETREKLRWFEAELEAQRQILNDRLANIYKHGEIEPVEAIVNNSSFSEIYTRLRLLLKIGEQDAELLQSLRDQKLKIEETKNSLDELFSQQKEITVQLEARKKVIEDKMRQEAAILASIDSETKAALAQEEEKRRQEQAEVVRRLTQEAAPAEPAAPAPASNPVQPSTQQSGKIAIQPGSVAFEALKYLGVPYVWGGEDPNIGLDCSGLVRIVFRKFGVDLYHYSGAQAQAGIPVNYDDLQSGDLVFFGSPIHHVGIYLGEGYYVHAPKRNDVVKISRMSDRKDHAGARRIITALPLAAGQF